MIKTQPKASVVAAIPSAPMVNPAATNKVAAVLQNGQTFVANTQPFIANIRVRHKCLCALMLFPTALIFSVFFLSSLRGYSRKIYI